ncbi:MAG: tRNA (N(6)-L-threonylcarbamoyladenosine(37)-C(2))-methylthiotransferase MtaB [Chloroflexi bacterium]|nr:tRNA (N(6)-L-threonylcarbamoyladenosine(37)-C(2))-methylthiotransferase MtaB [Chloroflexota bacterium]
MLFSRAMKVYLQALGCKLNESELEAWTRRFAEQGDEIVADARDAELCVLNTCTVTHVAARKSRQAARQMARANPNARVVLTGCYATMSPAEARALPNVALVVPNRDKEQLPQMANGILPVADCTQSAIQSPVNFSSSLATRHSSLRTRAFVKIQDGCNMSCTYCIIPLARGKERSRPLREVVAEVQRLTDAGVQEIILTGVQISAYREANFKFALRDLVAAILAETNVPRLRLTSIAPWDFDATLFELWSDPRLCRHLHFSLQSGSDSVLRRMRRPYTTAQYARAVEMAREKSPDVGITTDVIVGFPGETDAEFEASRQFVERIGFARAHVFPYSPREGTLAAQLPNAVSDRVKESRAQEMQAAAAASARAFAARFVGRTLPVLWETRQPTTDDRQQMIADGLSSDVCALWSGYTDNYIRVSAESALPLRNQITHTLLTGVAEDGSSGIVQ